MGAKPIKTWSLMKQALRNVFGGKNHEAQRQGKSRVKLMESSKNEEPPKAKELSQDKVEESLKTHRVNILSSKEKESELEKSDRVKENERFIEKQANEKEEQREKEIVVLEESEEVNFYANGTNSFFTSESLCAQNFEDSSKDEGGKLAYNLEEFTRLLSNEKLNGGKLEALDYHKQRKKQRRKKNRGYRRFLASKTEFRVQIEGLEEFTRLSTHIKVLRSSRE
ncbi:hypothetical protein M9H77_08046 [Catharanthus roseus]|uniref:Uncharacterized protein n=1 Tax=Catharanthus roseus TaxID=4058 RepID=A0ACC0BX08_CATRO|nr:hypothetical protein M9H77_08046 [Catharanthus roseus]